MKIFPRKRDTKCEKIRLRIFFQKSPKSKLPLSRKLKKYCMWSLVIAENGFRISGRLFLQFLFLMNFFCSSFIICHNSLVICHKILLLKTKKLSIEFFIVSVRFHWILLQINWSKYASKKNQLNSLASLAWKVTKLSLFRFSDLCDFF